jgi:YebC/PmpR family DNA-binding regulatory protein
MMGRKFENNKLKMAKTALAYAKKASYVGKQVVIAVKSGGDDPVTNLQLAAVIREANALNVPKDVIDRNVKKAMDPTTSASKELMYEAYGLGGVGSIINCLSDNNNRATSEVNTIVKKNSCSIASSGSVAFNFARKGRLTLNKEISEDDLLELAIEAGCEGDATVEEPDPDGMRADGEEVKCVVVTEQTELGLVQAALLDSGYECSGQLVHVPLTTVDCSAEEMEGNYAAIDKLEELDDVSSVEHNMAASCTSELK